MPEVIFGQRVQNAIPIVQGLYNQFKAIGVTMPVEDAAFIFYQCKHGDHHLFSTYCEDKLLALPAYANVVALGLGRPKTLEMATLPDFEKIRHWVLNDPAARGDVGRWDISPDLVAAMQIIGDVVSMKLLV